MMWVWVWLGVAITSGILRLWCHIVRVQQQRPYIFVLAYIFPKWSFQMMQLLECTPPRVVLYCLRYVIYQSMGLDMVRLCDHHTYGLSIDI